MQITSGKPPISAIDFTASGDAFQEIQAEDLRLPSLRNCTRSKTLATKRESTGRRQSRKSQKKDNSAREDW